MKQKRRNKGSGSIRKRPNGTWEGRYTDSSGKRCSVYGSSKSEVSKKIENLTYTRNTTQYDNIGGDIQFKIWFEHYINIKSLQIKEQSLDQIKFAFYKHIEPYIGNKPMCNINYNDVMIVVSNLQNKGLSMSTILNVISHMKAMFNFAKEEGILQKSPMFAMKIESKPKTTRRALTNEEINLLFNYIKKTDYKFYIILSTMIYTGIRPGEVCGIKWEDFDDDFSSIDINESITNNRYEKHEVKTTSSKRIIPINNFLQETFKSIYKRLDKPTGYVFTNNWKRTYTSAYIGIRFKSLKNALEKEKGIDLGDITPHYLRHTFATIGVQNGVSLIDMAGLLGHTNDRMLLEVYAHSNLERKAKSVDIITDYLKDII